MRLLQNQGALETIEAELSASSPSAEDQQRRFSELIPRRDRINRGLELLTRRAALEKQRVRIEKSKRGKPTSNFQPGLSTNTAQEFADEVAVVLTAWGFLASGGSFSISRRKTLLLMASIGRTTAKVYVR